jgi:hypothetical protein
MTRRIVAYAAAAVAVVALVGGCLADAAIPVAADDMKPGCHWDYYLRVIPVGMYCAD